MSDDGVVKGRTYFRKVDPMFDRSCARSYGLLDSVLDDLVDKGVETIVLQERHRRLVSSIEDWQNFGVTVGNATYLAECWMSV